MSIPTDYKMEAPVQGDFELMPADTYDVEIENIELLENKPVFNKPDETEDRFKFTFRITDGEFANRKLWIEARPVMSAGTANLTPSWLYRIYCAVNQVKLSDDEAKGVSGDMVNAMIGRKLRVIVQQKATKKGDLRNKITDVLPLKQSAASKPKDDVIQIDNDDIPF